MKDIRGRLEKSKPTHLVVYSTEAAYGSRLKHFLRESRNGWLRHWTGTQRMEPGDRVLFYFSKPTQAIVATGVVAAEPWLSEPTGDEDWTSSNRKIVNVDYRDVERLTTPLRLPVAGNRVLEDWWRTVPVRGSKTLNASVAQALWKQSNLVPPVNSIKATRKVSASANSRLKAILEGSRDEVVRELVFRDPRIKALAVDHYGRDCVVCGFNFRRWYGPEISEYVEVHHLRLLARAGPRKTTVEDVIVVCANCHRALHSESGEPLDWKLLRKRAAALRNRLASP